MGQVRGARFMTTLRSVIAGSVFSLSLFAFGAMARLAHADAAPVQNKGEQAALPFVEATINQVVEVATKLPGNENLTERRKKLREVINPRFDFAEMSRRSLGSKWNEITPAEQTDFTTVFSELLARTYLKKVETVKPGMVKMDLERLDFPRSSVKTLVTSNGDVFPIEYKLMNKDGTWKVYDVVVENIGLVANYRNEFAGIIRKDTFAGLMKSLHEKVD